MDDFAGRKIDQLWMPIKRKNEAFPERQDCSRWLVQLERPKAGSLDHVVDSQPTRTETRSDVVLHVILLEFGRSRHCNAIFIQPTG